MGDRKSGVDRREPFSRAVGGTGDSAAVRPRRRGGDGLPVVRGERHLGRQTAGATRPDRAVVRRAPADARVGGQEPRGDALDEGVIHTPGGLDDLGTGGEPRFEGLLYAASDRSTWGDRAGQCDNDVQVCIQSNPEVYGSTVAATVDVHSSAVEFEYDENLAGEQVEMYRNGTRSRRRSRT